MRAREELEIVLPALRLAFATATRLTEIRAAAGRKLPQGWSLTDIEPCEGGSALLVECDDDENGMGFLVSEDAGTLELHAVIDEALVLLGRRQAGGPTVLSRCRAA